jgi:hypothetical protein
VSKYLLECAKCTNTFTGYDENDQYCNRCRNEVELTEDAECPQCSYRGTDEEHGCPYDEEIGNGLKRCRCCESCQDECARAV